MRRVRKHADSTGGQGPAGTHKGSPQAPHRARGWRRVPGPSALRATGAQYSRRPSRALAMVTSSAHSRSEPTGHAHGDAGDPDAEGLEEPGQVDGRGLALDGRAGGEDDLLDAAGPRPGRAAPGSAARRARSPEAATAPRGARGSGPGSRASSRPPRGRGAPRRRRSTFGLRPGSEQMAHTSRSVIALQHRAGPDAVEQRRPPPRPAGSRPSGEPRSRWKAIRWADFGPIPGSLRSSSISRATGAG